MMNEYTLILGCCHQGQKNKGVAKGSHVLKDIIQKTNNEIKKIHEVTIDEFDTIDGYKKLFDYHQDSINNGYVPIVLGGDHSIGHVTVGSSLQKYKDELLVLWIDAHGDINTLDASKSKNTHGTPLSGLIGLEKPWISDITNLLKPENLIYFGVRELDKYESDIIKEKNIRNYRYHRDTYLNKERYFNMIKFFMNQYKYIHISFDVDSLDPSFLDSTGTISNNGVTPDEVIKLFQFAKSRLVGIDITEFNPDLGNIDKSNDTIDYIIRNIL